MIAGDLTSLPNVKSWLGISTTNDDVQLTRLISAASQYVQSWMNRQFAVVTKTEARNGTGTAMMALGDWPVVSISSLVVNGTAIVQSIDGVAAGYVFDSRMLYLIGYIFPMGLQNVKVTYTVGYQKTNEAATIQSTPSYTLDPATLSLPWSGGLSVSFASGVALTKVTAAPTAGQYSLLSSGGLWTYTFAAADAGKAILLTYMYTPPEIEQACIELISLRYRERSRIGENSKSIGGETVSFNVKDFPEGVKTILNNYRRVISVY